MLEPSIEPPVDPRATPPAIDSALASRLLAEQFPAWARLPLTLLEPAGSDHVIFRLGDTMSVRLPRGHWAAGQAVKEQRWLPLLAPELPLAVPVPLGLGQPSRELAYPWQWSVTRWLEGSVATTGTTGQHPSTATRLAGFLTALQRIAPSATKLPGPHPELAGSPLGERDEDTRKAIAATAGVFDVDAMTAVWEAALDAPARTAAPVWFHGDFHTGNLLADPTGLPTAVIDFGGLGMGDPACDLMIAFTLLDADGRAAFRTALGTDDATWARGTGWALATGLNAYTTYAATHPQVAAQTTHQITQALTEHRRPSD